MFSAKRLGMWAVAVVSVLCMTASQASADAVYAWGSDYYGQLGNGTLDYGYGYHGGFSYSPGAIGDLSRNVTTVLASEHSSFAIKDGGLWYWGKGDNYLFGKNNFSPVASRVMSSGVTAIATNSNHSLILKDGGIWAGGDNSYGQLSNEVPSASSSLVALTTGPMSSGVTAVAVGAAHSLALKDGGVWTWGRNNAGQLGNGTTDGTFSANSNPTPTALTGPMSSGVTAIVAEGHHSLAIKDGGVWVWGYNGSGLFGNEVASSQNTPVALTGPMSSGVTAIAVTTNGFCLAIKDGGVWAWGYNNYGQLGDGTTTSRFTPAQVDPANLHDIVAIAVGTNSSYALSADGSLWVWGDNRYGQLGLGGGITPQHLLPPDGCRYTSISASRNYNDNLPTGDHVLATVMPIAPIVASESPKRSAIIITLPSVKVTFTIPVTGVVASDLTINGSPATQVIGTGAGPYTFSGFAVPANGDVNVDLASGSITNGDGDLFPGDHWTYAKLANAPVYAWGYNGYGQLGDGTTINRGSLVAVTGLSDDATVFATGGDHSLAIVDGGVWTWGWNDQGQLGDGTQNSSLTPIALTGAMASGVTAITGGDKHSLAVKNGGIWTWGINDYGQLGNGTTNSQTSPVALTGEMSNGVTAIAASFWHSLALKNGGVWAWGYNGYGQLGDGTTTQRNSPVALPGPMSSGVTAITGGYYYSLALKDGGVWAWGYNGYGQLGDGTYNNNPTPTALTGPMSSGVTAIAAGGWHSLALKDGRVWAWGSGDIGQLGNGMGGSYANSNVPVPVDPTHMYNIVAIAAGQYSSYALSTDGSLWVWGDNYFGQLGIGTTGDQYSTPLRLLPPKGFRYTSINTGCNSYHVLATLMPVAPTVKTKSPKRNATFFTLPSVEITFTMPVTGVAAGDLTVNGSPATSVTGAGAGPYLFTGFTPPVPGTVQVALAAGTIKNGDGDLFDGDSWTYTKLAPALSNVTPVRNATIIALPSVEVTFTIPVTGVAAGDLTVNGSPATSVTGTGTGPYLFTGFAPPAPGTVQVALAARAIKNGDGDLFNGDSWTYTKLAPTLSYIDPARDANVANLPSVTVVFSTPMTGVVAGNLAVNGSPATSVTGTGAGPYSFSGFAIPAAGEVNVVLASGSIINGEGDLFDGDSWTYTQLAPAVVYAWGDNSYGQLGDGTTTQRNSPVAVMGLLGNVTTVATGYSHSLALKNGGVWTWGQNRYGQLGNGTGGPGNQSLTPTALTGPMSSGVTAIAGGNNHSFALKDGGIWAWGYNGYGQLGDGTTTQRNSPVALPGPMSSGVTAITGGYYYSLALKDGGVWAWGYNGYGQLGDGTTTQRNSPVALTGPMSSGVTAIAGGEEHSLALKEDGSVWAWGQNWNGQLGDGTGSPGSQSSTPIALTGEMSSGVTAIAAGGYYSLALKNGGVWAWGQNWNGQLGDGTMINRSTPVQIDPTHLHDIIAIAAGGLSSYALSADGSLWVWGDNSFGQLGLGTSGEQYNTPQQLLPPYGCRYTSMTATRNSARNCVLATVAPASTGCSGHPADFNGDCRVDDTDISFLLSCFTGPEGSVTSGCQVADINHDNMIDMVDFAILQRCLAPEPALLNPNCAD